MKYDIVVVGAGLGGLTAAAKLAKEGRKVLVLEQHDRPGGCATTFRRKDFTMEVGLHEMDGMHRADPKLKVFTELGITDRVEFLEVPEFYRFVNGRVDVVVPHRPDEAKKVLKQLFPAEAAGIDSYFDTVLNARRIARDWGSKPDSSIGDFLDGIIKDEDLKLVLLGNLGYFHDDPYTLSWLYYINAQGAYYGAGRANFIKGGSQRLSDALKEVIEENGGEVRLNTLVTGIVYRDGKPSGVRYREAGTKGGDDALVEAEDLVINASVYALAGMLNEGDGKKLLAGAEGNAIGASLLTVYFGFRTSLRELGHRYYSSFYFDSSIRCARDIKPNNRSDFSQRSFTFVDYSQVDSGLAPASKSVGAACCVDYPDEWEQLTREAYKKKKAEVAELITARLEAFIPGFREAVEYVEVGTSLTVKRYTLNPEGAVYGFAQHPGKSLAYLSALPDGIHLASAWGKFGGGFSGAIICGYMTAFDILRKGRIG
jgi:phytoene dehydrogenase-like protein